MMIWIRRLVCTRFTKRTSNPTLAVGAASFMVIAAGCSASEPASAPTGAAGASTRRGSGGGGGQAGHDGGNPSWAGGSGASGEPSWAGGSGASPEEPSCSDPAGCQCSSAEASEHWNSWDASLTYYCLAQGTPQNGVACAYLETARHGSGCGNDNDGVDDALEDVSTGGGAYFAAMNTQVFRRGASCGGCVEIERQLDSGVVNNILVTVVDECPEGSNPLCRSAGHIDLSQAAYRALASDDLSIGEAGTNPYFTSTYPGRGRVRWRWTACPVAASSEIRVRFNAGTNPYWTMFALLGQRYSIDQLQVMKDGAFVNAGRDSGSNGWYVPAGMNRTPFVIRATSHRGQVLDFTGIGPQSSNGWGTLVSTGAQFPRCNE